MKPPLKIQNRITLMTTWLSFRPVAFSPCFSTGLALL